MTVDYPTDNWSLGEGEPGLVSYIIPAYNAERYILETLRSCYRQTYRPIEVIVVNDGSTDGTEQAVAEFKAEHAEPGFKIVSLTQENAGGAAARNAGLLQSRGELIGFLDADDVLPSGRTAVLLELIRSQRADIAYGRHATFSESHECDRYDAPAAPDKPELVSLVPLFKYVPAIWSFLVRRSLVERTGPFVSAFRNYGEDTEYVFRMRCHTPRIARARNVVLMYRRMAGSVTRSRNPERARVGLRVTESVVDTLKRVGASEPESWRRVPAAFADDGLKCLRYGLSAEAVRAFALAAAYERGFRKGWRSAVATALRVPGAASVAGGLLGTRDRCWLPIRDRIQRGRQTARALQNGPTTAKHRE